MTFLQAYQAYRGSLDTICAFNTGNLDTEIVGEDIVLHLPITMNEEIEFPKERPRLRSRVIFDCANTRLVNSVGASIWIEWMRRNDRRQQYVFRNCPRKVVEMMSYMPDFLPQEYTVESFFAPYECLGCGYEGIELNLRGKDFLEAHSGGSPTVKVPSELNCPKCTGKMEFAVIENVYLRFLNSEAKS